MSVPNIISIILLPLSPAASLFCTQFWLNEIQFCMLNSGGVLFHLRHGCIFCCTTYREWQFKMHMGSEDVTEKTNNSLLRVYQIFFVVDWVSLYIGLAMIMKNDSNEKVRK
jgi:hypothetical protein